MMFRVAGIGCLALSIAIVSGSTRGRSSEPPDSAIAERHHLTLDEVQLLKGFRGLTPGMLLGLPTARIKKMLYRVTQPKPTDALGAFKHIALIQTGGEGVIAPEGAFDSALAEASSIRRTFAAPSTRPASAVASRGSGSADETVSVAGVPITTLSATSAPKASGDGRVPLAYAPLLPQAQTRTRPQGDLSPRNWNWLGPTNIGGRTRALVIHPTAPNIMWAAGTTGGIWKSIDAGANWAPLADFMATLNVGALAIDPHDPNILFAGTGEGTRDVSTRRGMGVYRSLDGGASWTRLAETGVSAFRYVNRIAFTSDGTVMLIATSTGVYRSINFRDNNPASVQFVGEAAPAPGQRRGFTQVLCSPKDARLCLAAGDGLELIFSSDAGLSWRNATGLPGFGPDSRGGGRVELTFAAADPAIVYASIDINSSEIWRSNDGGRSFTRRSSATRHLGTQGWLANTIWAGDPNRVDLVLVGGLDLHRSMDGGQTLTLISDWRYAPQSAHADQHTIVSHPGYNGRDNQVVYFGNDGGIYRHANILTATPDTGWVAINNNYGITQFYSAAGNVQSGRIIGGAQDNGTLVYVPPAAEGGPPQAFGTTYGGDGAYSAADPEDPRILYGSTQNLGLHRSMDGGQRSDSIARGLTDAGDPPPGQPRRALFIAPFTLDPGNRTTMLAGGASLWRSRNVIQPTPTWQTIKPPLMAAAGERGPILISAIEARRTDPSAAGSNLVWVGHANGSIYRTANGLADQPDWEDVGAAHPRLPRGRIITRIRAYRDVAFSALNEGAGTLFVTYGGYSRANIWRSTDDGRTWTDIHGNLPAVAIADVAAHPRNPGLLYVATELGVFASADAGTTWAPTNQGPANVSVTELFWMGERLVAATFGRGLFWIDLSGLVGIASAPTPAPTTPPAAPAPAAPAPPPPAATATPPSPAPPKLEDPTEVLRSR